MGWVALPGTARGTRAGLGRVGEECSGGPVGWWITGAAGSLAEGGDSGQVLAMVGDPAVEALFEWGEAGETVEPLEEGNADELVKDEADGLGAAVASAIWKDGPDALFALLAAEAVALGQAADLEGQTGQTSAPVEALEQLRDGGAEVATAVEDDDGFDGMAMGALGCHGCLLPPAPPWVPGARSGGAGGDGLGSSPLVAFSPGWLLPLPLLSF